MLNYRTVRSGFFLVIFCLVVCVIIWNISIWWFLPVIAVYFGLNALGSFKIQTNYYLPSICKGKGNKGISLSFDDGPHPDFTPRLINLLEKHQIKATFFLIGKNIPGNEYVVRLLEEKGHIIGNHTFAHTSVLPFYPANLLKKDLKKTQTLIADIIGKQPVYFRPPFGVTSPPYSKVIKDLRLTSVGWSNRSLDTIEKDPVKIFERVRKQISGGDIILFHDTSERILVVIEMLLIYIAENGIKVVPLDELINIKPYANS